MINKRGISPIVATVLLIAFAVALGAMIMNWSRSLVEEEASCEDLVITLKTPLCKMENKVIPIALQQEKEVLCLEKSIHFDKVPACKIES